MFTTIESLETRSLYASISFTNGTLTIVGNDSRDVISVDLVGDRIIATVNGVTSTGFAHVDAISVSALGGNDVVAVHANVPSKLRGGSGNDQLYGGPNNDRLDGGAGSDFLSGGRGRDSVDYSTRTADLDIDVQRGGYNDGESGEHDNVRGDVEGIAAGSGDDHLTGWLYNDAIFGGAGNDTVIGDDGDDTLNGDAGQDDLYGNDDDDRLSGGDGDDFLDSGGGRNFMLGNAGDDLFDARNGNTDHAMNGGSGFDRAKIDYLLRAGPDDADNVSSVERRTRYLVN